VHRFLELYSHTLPAFGHVGQFQELLFETAHEPLKREIKRSNNRDPQISAVQEVLANDWETRLAVEIASVGKPDQWSDTTYNLIQRLLTGVECTYSTEADRVKSAFCPPVMHKLESVRGRLLSLPKIHVEWRFEYGQHNSCSSFEETLRASSPTNEGIVAQALLCAGSGSQGGINGSFQALLVIWASSWSVTPSCDPLGWGLLGSHHWLNSACTFSLASSSFVSPCIHVSVMLSSTVVIRFFMF
jgi:hypothetical protein